MKFRIVPPNRAVDSWTVEGFYQDGKWKPVDTFKSRLDAKECVKSLLATNETDNFHYIEAQSQAEYL